MEPITQTPPKPLSKSSCCYSSCYTGAIHLVRSIWHGAVSCFHFATCGCFRGKKITILKPEALVIPKAGPYAPCTLLKKEDVATQLQEKLTEFLATDATARNEFTLPNNTDSLNTLSETVFTLLTELRVKTKPTSLAKGHDSFINDRVGVEIKEENKKFVISFTVVKTKESEKHAITLANRDGLTFVDKTMASLYLPTIKKPVELLTFSFETVTPVTDYLVKSADLLSQLVRDYPLLSTQSELEANILAVMNALQKPNLPTPQSAIEANRLATKIWGDYTTLQALISGPVRLVITTTERTRMLGVIFIALKKDWTSAIVWNPTSQVLFKADGVENPFSAEIHAEPYLGEPAELEALQKSYVLRPTNHFNFNDMPSWALYSQEEIYNDLLPVISNWPVADNTQVQVKPDKINLLSRAIYDQLELLRQALAKQNPAWRNFDADRWHHLAFVTIEFFAASEENEENIDHSQIIVSFIIPEQLPSIPFTEWHNNQLINIVDHEDSYEWEDSSIIPISQVPLPVQTLRYEVTSRAIDRCGAPILFGEMLRTNHEFLESACIQAFGANSPDKQEIKNFMWNFVFWSKGTATFKAIQDPNKQWFLEVTFPSDCPLMASDTTIAAYKRFCNENGFNVKDLSTDDLGGKWLLNRVTSPAYSSPPKMLHSSQLPIQSNDKQENRILIKVFCGRAFGVSDDCADELATLLENESNVTLQIWDNDPTRVVCLLEGNSPLLTTFEEKSKPLTAVSCKLTIHRRQLIIKDIV